MMPYLLALNTGLYTMHSDSALHLGIRWRNAEYLLDLAYSSSALILVDVFCCCSCAEYLLDLACSSSARILVDVFCCCSFSSYGGITWNALLTIT